VPVLLENLIELVGTLPADQTGKERNGRAALCRPFDGSEQEPKGRLYLAVGMGIEMNSTGLLFFLFFFLVLRIY
jgi:hypothetical protein